MSPAIPPFALIVVVFTVPDWFDPPYTAVVVPPVISIYVDWLPAWFPPPYTFVVSPPFM